MRLFFYSLDIILISFLFVSNPVDVDGRPVGPSGLSNAQTSETFMGYIVAQNFKDMKNDHWLLDKNDAGYRGAWFERPIYTHPGAPKNYIFCKVAQSRDFIIPADVVSVVERPHSASPLVSTNELVHRQRFTSVSGSPAVLQKTTGLNPDNIVLNPVGSNSRGPQLQMWIPRAVILHDIDHPPLSISKKPVQSFRENSDAMEEFECWKSGQDNQQLPTADWRRIAKDANINLPEQYIDDL
ncbi:hypothetical protein F5878DRAFT_629496 [Lentinula raphanica]|uniref:Uncharacterized protein n=1 Tax=Lentinula raphanica TaxID=153919 RepID=A0AA38P212_9AGAR|nr:hypothetical protein F5878DRAFT_629496 [Lentinula raphanica]